MMPPELWKNQCTICQWLKHYRGKSSLDAVARKNLVDDELKHQAKSHRTEWLLEDRRE